MPPAKPTVAQDCHAAVSTAIDNAGGWLPFDAFLALALHHPHYGYYGSGRVQLGGNGDFHTAPTLSPLFADVLAQLMLPYLADGGAVLELGAGDGTLAEQLQSRLARESYSRYFILETSPALAARQQKRLARFEAVEWLTTLPQQHNGFVLVNEVLDCVPFRLLRRHEGRWCERGVVAKDGALSFALQEIKDDAAAALPPLPDGYETEISPQAAALTATLAACLQKGCLFIADYGFGRSEYYHPQRAGGTMLCHQAQRVSDDALTAVGEKDITAHVDFTAIADAGMQGGCRLAGYVTQAQGLINGGMLELLKRYQTDTATYARATAGAHKLTAPHEMGESVKWMAFVKGDVPPPPAFAEGDIRHRL